MIAVNLSSSLETKSAMCAKELSRRFLCAVRGDVRDDIEKYIKQDERLMRMKEERKQIFVGLEKEI